MTFQALLKTYEELYKEQAPKRYAEFQKGITIADIDNLKKELLVATIPPEFLQLYAWKNGQRPQGTEGWESEFEEGAWYEFIPLDKKGDTFMPLEEVIDWAKHWEKVSIKLEKEGKRNYWKKGFIPFLSSGNWAMTVVDTLGHFGGRANQIISFDYTSRAGYFIEHKSLYEWMQTNILLLEEKAYFHDNFYGVTPEFLQLQEKIAAINTYRQGDNHIPLEII